MPLGEFTKQIAQQALLSATAPKEAPPKEAAPPPADSAAPAIMAQIGAMQKQLKDDEELAVTFHQGAERIRVMEIFLPSPQVVVLTGLDANRTLTRVISAAAALQLICKTVKTAPGSKPIRVGLITPQPATNQR
jgi:hypothetical protein